MRALRERPRLVAAKLTLAVCTLIAAVLVGSAIAASGPDPPTGLRPRLERSQQARDLLAREVRHTAAESNQLRAELRTTARRARTRARTSQRLRRELQAVRRSLARARRP